MASTAPVVDSPHVAPKQPPTPAMIVRGARALRKVLFWCHLTVAVTVGIVILIMSLTGVLLAYDRQVLDWVASRYHVTPPSPVSQRLPLDTLLARVRMDVPGSRVALITLNADPTEPTSVGFQDRRDVFVDPYTGKVVGNDTRIRGFFFAVTRWHRSLSLGEGVRSPLGTGITGACTIAFLFLLITGLYLWWPRQWSARGFKPVLFFTPRAQGKARDWNWHHVLGFWFAPVLCLIIVSGLFMSYRWPNSLVERMAGGGTSRSIQGRRGEDADGAERGRRGPQQGRETHERGMTVSFDTLWSQAAQQVHDWQSIQIRLPRAPGSPLSVSVSNSSGSRPDQRVQFTVNQKTGVLERAQRAERTDLARKIRSLARPIHTGEIAGVSGQTIAALAAAAGVLLVWTGLSLALRRLRTSLTRRQRVHDPC